MRRRLLLSALWSSVLMVCIVSIGSVVPGIVARYYIAQLDISQMSQTSTAFSRLEWMGKWAVPALLVAIDERAPNLADLRQDKLPGFRANDAIGKFHRLRESSPAESRADLCVALLFEQWHSGVLSEYDRKHIRPYLQSGAINLRTQSYPVDRDVIRFEARLDQYLCAEEECFDLARRGFVIVRNSRGETVFPLTDLVGAGTAPSFERTYRRAGPAWPVKSKLNVASATIHLALSPRQLGIGKHEIYFRVAPVSTGETGQAADGPWNEEFIYGPVEIEIVPGLAADQPSESSGDSITEY